MAESDAEMPYQPDWAKIKRKMDNLPTLEKLLAEKNPNEYSEEDLALAKVMARDLIARDPRSDETMKSAMMQQRKHFKTDNKKSLLLAGYRALVESTDPAERIPRHPFIESFLITKAPRSHSGVLVVTVFTSPYPDGQKFSCQWNCYYCPNEPGQPRSYLLNEPGVRRANRLEFDAMAQFRDRVKALVDIGHPADKVELLVLGGTWESYPVSYRDRFIRDLFYAANTFFDDEATRRPPHDILQEQIINETALCKIIGVTLETRPDTIAPDMLVQMRRYGCTRVQLGVQHVDDGILQLINRDQTREDVARAIRLLKDSCFKVDIHLMPDLPGTTAATDKAMFDDVLYSPDLQADQWKIYPCQTTPFTVIKKWHEEGKYQPFSMDTLVDVLLYAKRRVHPWIRLNRVIRDIPIEYVLAGCEVANLRQLLDNRMAREGDPCKCLRCREVKSDPKTNEKLKTSVLVDRRYEASGGQEVFLSFETPDERTLFGFLRLRFAGPPVEGEAVPFPELQGCALIRELHVYGNLISTYDSEGRAQKAQHTGIGTKLLQWAERVASEAGYTKIAVISGVGVRSYYQKRGYRTVEVHRGAFLIKDLKTASSAEGSMALTLAALRGVASAAVAPFRFQRAPAGDELRRPRGALRAVSIADRLMQPDRLVFIVAILALLFGPYVMSLLS